MQAKSSVLVVDDDVANRRLLGDLVTREGYEALVAAGGAEALDVLSRERVDLVLLDLMMPGVDGMAVLAEMRARGSLPGLPVVVVTAREDRDARIAVLSAGASDFLTKPIDRLEVTCRLRTLLELRRLREDAVTHAKRSLLEEIQEAVSAVPLLLYRDAFPREDSPEAGAWIVGDVEKLTGRPDEVAAGPRGWMDLIHPDDLAALERDQDAASRAPASSAISHQLRLRSSAEERWVAHVASFDVERRTQTGALLDITAQKSLEMCLRQSQKMEAFGQLAGGVAHDFNNILSVILSFGDCVLDALPEGDERRDDMLELLHAAERAVGLTSQLLAFSRRQPTRRRPTDLNQSVALVSKLLARTLGARVALVVTPAERPAVVSIDPVQFDQVILNLAVNARDAMPHGGRLEIALEHVSASDAAGGATGVVRVTVRDTGTGIDPRTRERIFEPFFTSAKGQGTGLGLATCFSIVTAAGGSMRVDSTVGEGSTFTIELPASAEPVVTTDRPPSADVSPGGGGRHVLLAEDDPALRRALARVLEEADFTVYAVASGPEAIRALDAYGSSLDAVVSDVVMPDVGGYEIADHCAVVAPRAAVVLMSGHVDDLAMQSRDLPVLQKPVRPADLVSALTDGIAGKRARESPLRPPAPEAASMASAGRVLIVTDDASESATYADTLRAGGFDVVRTASEGGTSFGELDCVLAALDVGEPQVVELLRRLLPRYPDVPVVIVARASVLASATPIRGVRVRDMLPRTVSPDELVRVVSSAADAGRIARMRVALASSRGVGEELARDAARLGERFERALASLRVDYQPIVRAEDLGVFGHDATVSCDEPSLAASSRLVAAAHVLGRSHELGLAGRASVARTLATSVSAGVNAVLVHVCTSELLSDVLLGAQEPLLPHAHRVLAALPAGIALDAGSSLAGSLARLRARGYRVALDGLGEGDSSFASLAVVRPDVVVLGPSLTRGIDRARLRQEIVGTVVGMARRAGALVLAADVDGQREHATLAALGCHLLQGPRLAAPGLPFPDVEVPPSKASS